MPCKLIVKATKVNMVEFDPVTKLGQLNNLSGIEPFGACDDNHKNTVVNNVNANPRRGFDASKPCLVCQQTGHTFDDCPVLKNTSHLRKHCVGWKMCLANEHGKELEPLQQTQINQLEAECVATKSLVKRKRSIFWMRQPNRSVTLWIFNRGSCERVQQFNPSQHRCCLTAND